MKQDSRFYTKFSLRTIVFLVFASIQLPLLIGLTYWGHRQLDREVTEKFQLLRHQTENNILSSLQFVDAGMGVIKSALEDDLLHSLELLLPSLEEDWITYRTVCGSYRKLSLLSHGLDLYQSDYHIVQQ